MSKPDQTAILLHSLFAAIDEGRTSKVFELIPAEFQLTPAHEIEAQFNKGELAEEWYRNWQAVVNFQSEEILSPLEAAITRGHTDIVRILVKTGADINFEMLHLAALHNHNEIFKILISANPTFDPENLKERRTSGASGKTDIIDYTPQRTINDNAYDLARYISQNRNYLHELVKTYSSHDPEEFTKKIKDFISTIKLSERSEFLPVIFRDIPLATRAISAHDLPLIQLLAEEGLIQLHKDYTRNSTINFLHSKDLFESSLEEKKKSNSGMLSSLSSTARQASRIHDTISKVKDQEEKRPVFEPQEKLRYCEEKKEENKKQGQEKRRSVTFAKPLVESSAKSLKPSHNRSRSDAGSSDNEKHSAEKKLLKHHQRSATLATLTTSSDRVSPVPRKTSEPTEKKLRKEKSYKKSSEQTRPSTSVKPRGKGRDCFNCLSILTGNDQELGKS